MQELHLCHCRDIIFLDHYLQSTIHADSDRYLCISKSISSSPQLRQSIQIHTYANSNALRKATICIFSENLV